MNIKTKILLGFLTACFIIITSLGCVYKSMPLSPMELSVVLDDENIDHSKDVLDENYQKQFFSLEELRQLSEFDSGYDPNDVFQSVGEKNIIGTSVHLQRVDDVYLDGYAFFQKGLKSVKLKMGYTEMDFKKAYFRGRKTDFYILKRIPFPRNSQAVKVLLEAEDGEKTSIQCIVPFIMEIKGLVDSMEINTEKPFELGVVGDGQRNVLIYNEKPKYKGVDTITYVHKSMLTDDQPFVFSPQEMDVLKSGKAFVSINAKVEAYFNFLDMDGKVVARASEPLIPVVIKKRYAD